MKKVSTETLSLVKDCDAVIAKMEEIKKSLIEEFIEECRSQKLSEEDIIKFADNYFGKNKLSSTFSFPHPDVYDIGRILFKRTPVHSHMVDNILEIYKKQG